MTPSNTMFVAFPSSFGPMTLEATLKADRTITAMTRIRSGRSLPTRRQNVPLKSFGLAAGSIAPPNIPPGPAGAPSRAAEDRTARATGRESGRAGRVRSAHATSASLSCEKTISR